MWFGNGTEIWLTCSVIMDRVDLRKVSNLYIYKYISNWLKLSNDDDRVIKPITDSHSALRGSLSSSSVASLLTSSSSAASSKDHSSGWNSSGPNLSRVETIFEIYILSSLEQAPRWRSLFTCPSRTLWGPARLKDERADWCDAGAYLVHLATCTRRECWRADERGGRRNVWRPNRWRNRDESLFWADERQSRRLERD